MPEFESGTEFVELEFIEVSFLMQAPGFAFLQEFAAGGCDPGSFRTLIVPLSVWHIQE